MDELLKNKTAVVYGAGSIGSAVARAFANAGAAVFVADHNADALQKLAGAQIQTAQVDVLTRTLSLRLCNPSPNRRAVWTSRFAPPQRINRVATRAPRLLS